MSDFPIEVSVAEHPSVADLTAFGQGCAASLDETVRIENHLAGCTVCCALVASSPPDRVVQLIATASQSAAPDSKPPQLRVMAGFEILDVLGRGGMGVVYRARQIGLNRIVALKRLRIGVLADGEDLSRFRREAVALARVQHPNIVQIHDAGDQDGHPYLALEYVEGPSLRTRLDQSPLQVDEAARLLAVLADAVDFAHRHGVVHRDLKPSNVLLANFAAPSDPSGKLPADGATSDVGAAISGTHLHGTLNPKITDFGLAKLFEVGADAEQTHTCVMGTPGYMAPEQSRASAEPVGPAADIYSLGAVLYEALTGRPPFLAATAYETFELAHTCDPPSPRRLQPCVPLDLETICLKCLRHDPAARYATAADLARDLRSFLEGSPIAARPVSRAERLWKWVRRRPALAALNCLIAVAVIAAVAGVFLHQQELRQQTEHAERNYRDSWRTIQGLLLKSEDPRSVDAAQHDQLRREQLNEAVPFFERILAETSPTNIELRNHRLLAQWELSRLCHELGRSADAAQHLHEAIATLETLTADRAARLDDFYLLGECYSREAAQRRDSGDTRGWLERNMAAANEFQRTVALEPERAVLKSRLAECWTQVGFAYRELGRLELASQSLAEAHKLRFDVCQLESESPAARSELAAVCFHQIDLYRHHDSDAVPAVLLEVDQLLTPLAELTTADQRVALPVAGAFVRWGQILKTENETTALQKFDVAQRMLGEFLKHQPNSRQARWHLTDAHVERAIIADIHGRHAQAIRDWDRAVELAPGISQLLFCRMRRALSLVSCPDPRRATEQLEVLLSDPVLSADDLGFLARSTAHSIIGLQNQSALSDADRVEYSDRCAALAIALLRKAVKLGYYRGRRADDLIAENPMFELLRTRDDFHAILHQLETLQ